MKRESNLTLQTTTIALAMVVIMLIVSNCGGGDGIIPNPVVPTENPTGGPTEAPTEVPTGNLTGRVFDNTISLSGAFVTCKSYLYGTDVSSSDAKVPVFFTTTAGSQGEYNFNNVPAGPGRLEFWENEQDYNNNPSNPMGAREITVVANTTTTIDLNSGVIDPTPIPQPTNTPIPLPPATPIPTVTPGGGNVAPLAPQDLYPANGAVDQPVNITLSGVYQDANADPGSMRFYWANGTPIGTDSSVDPGTRGEVSVNGLANNTTYQWYAIANDGTVDGPQSATVGFTTTAAVDPTPTFTPIPTADPTITSWTKRAGIPGDLTTVTGTNFGATQGTVTFDDAGTPRNATITGWTNTQITLNIPNGNYINTMNHVAVTIKRSDNKTVVENKFLVLSDFTVLYNTFNDEPFAERYGPADACLDNSGNIYITGGDGMIRKYTFPSMTNRSKSIDFGSPPINIFWLSSTNRLYANLVTDYVSLLTDFSGILNFGNGVLGQARGMAYLPTTNEIIFADQNRVQKFSLDGTHNIAGSFPFKYSTAIGISCSSDGNIFVGDINTDKFVRYNQSGTFIEEWTRDCTDSHVVKIDQISYLLTIGINSQFKSNLQIDDVTGPRVNVSNIDFESSVVTGGNGIFVDPSDGTIIIIDSDSGNIVAGTI